MVEEFQLLPFSTCTAGAGYIGGGGIIFGGMEEVEVVEEGGPGGVRQGGGVEQQPPQLVQGRGAAELLTLSYGSMAVWLLVIAVGLPSVNSGTRSMQGPWTETRPAGEEGRGDQWNGRLQLLSPTIIPHHGNTSKSCHQ